MQSCGGEINLLPALPDEWRSGHIRGLRAKGGFGVDIAWRNGKLDSAVIISDHGGECRLRANCVVSIVCQGVNVGSRIEDGVIIFNTEKGAKYLVKA
jgi:alpha-L-fucosidase 2